jgi:hypothetical protein
MRERFLVKRLVRDFGEANDEKSTEQVHLKVNVVKATNLINIDKNKLLKNKVSDPFVQCWYVFSSFCNVHCILIQWIGLLA